MTETCASSEVGCTGSEAQAESSRTQQGTVTLRHPSLRAKLCIRADIMVSVPNGQSQGVKIGTSCRYPGSFKENGEKCGSTRVIMRLANGF
jgi:hypothetical protein